MKKYLLPTIIAISALAVSGSAAYYSVYGLSKLFAGAQTEVAIMAGSLEAAKLVIASFLYQYWESINKLLRSYLTLAACVLVLITSMGIYGFLSAAYQETYQGVAVQENEIAFVKQKQEFYEKDLYRYDQELERISDNINTLSKAKAQTIEVRDTSVSTGTRQTVSTAELRLAQKRIEVEEENRANIQAKRQVVSDSVQKFQMQILELENNSTLAGELGPLRYISGLTGQPMDKVINILLLVIIFVFDPLAVSLVIAANLAFKKIKQDNTKPEVLLQTKEKETLETDTVIDVEPQYSSDVVNTVDITEEENEEELFSEPDPRGMDVSYEIITAPTPAELAEERSINKKIVEIKQKGLHRSLVLFSDGTTAWVPNNAIENINKKNYL